MTDTKPRAKHPLTVGRAYDKLAALHADRHEACDKAVQKVHATYAERENAILAQLSEGDAEKVRSLLHDSDDTPHDPEFGVDPKDSARLLALRDAIDEHLGWLSDEQEEEADYVARIIGVRVELDKLRTELSARSDPAPPEVATTGEPRGVSDYVPGPAARAARGGR